MDNNGNEITAAATEKTGLTVKSYSRAGFAHFNCSGVGAYNNDGTLKSGVQVIYLTANNAKTVSATLSSGTFTGIQAILAAYESGNVTTPLDVRIIGCINAGDVDSFGSSAEGLQIKGKSGYSTLNITIEGIGDDFIPGIVDEELIDDIVLIHDCDAINMSKRIAQELGLGIGISSGANFLASVIMDNDDLKIATVFPDDNKKYITTKLSEPIDENPELISNHIKLIGFEVI